MPAPGLVAGWKLVLKPPVVPLWPVYGRVIPILLNPVLLQIGG